MHNCKCCKKNDSLICIDFKEINNINYKYTILFG